MSNWWKKTRPTDTTLVSKIKNLFPSSKAKETVKKFEQYKKTDKYKKRTGGK